MKLKAVIALNGITAAATCPACGSANTGMASGKAKCRDCGRAWRSGMAAETPGNKAADDGKKPGGKVKRFKGPKGIPQPKVNVEKNWPHMAV